MKIKELITQLEKVSEKSQERELFNDKNDQCQSIGAYLKHLKQLDPNTIVQVSNGDCEDDGIYAPVKKDGGMDIHKAKPFKVGQPFPDDGHDWVKVGYFEAGNTKFIRPS